jgi:RNA polymerase sigma factor (sigma-70 family)
VGSGFPPTRYSVIAGVGSSDPVLRQVAWNALVQAYWRPLYKYARLKWRHAREDAEDLTQSFFTRALEKSFFAGYDPGKARFRTFLRTCFEGFAANEWKAAHRLKRGGGSPLLSLDFVSAEGELVGIEIEDPKDIEVYFQSEWVRGLLASAVLALREECETDGKRLHFEAFSRYDVDPPPEGRPSYQQLAQDLGLPASQVTNYLAWARRRFRALVLDQLRALTASDEEFRAEARTILGVDPR